MTWKRKWEIGAAAALLVMLALTSGACWVHWERQRRLNEELGRVMTAAVQRSTDRVAYARVQQLLAAGAAPRARLTKELLEVAVVHGDLKLTQRLLDEGVDPNPATPWPPLRLAMIHGHQDIEELLREHGARESWPREFPRSH